ncbi:hypothetical protein HDU97_000990 [Phlyctochytrium planicorne]|nr:hypothetical protein HDU97_000990 [Phlyctochytrium planicorne]
MTGKEMVDGYVALAKGSASGSGVVGMVRRSGTEFKGMPSQSSRSPTMAGGASGPGPTYAYSSSHHANDGKKRGSLRELFSLSANPPSLSSQSAQGGTGGLQGEETVTFFERVSTVLEQRVEGLGKEETDAAWIVLDKGEHIIPFELDGHLPDDLPGTYHAGRASVGYFLQVSVALNSIHDNQTNIKHNILHHSTSQMLEIPLPRFHPLILPPSISKNASPLSSSSLVLSNHGTNDAIRFSCVVSNPVVAFKEDLGLLLHLSHVRSGVQVVGLECRVVQILDVTWEDVVAGGADAEINFTVNSNGTVVLKGKGKGRDGSISPPPLPKPPGQQSLTPTFSSPTAPATSPSLLRSPSPSSTSSIDSDSDDREPSTTTCTRTTHHRTQTFETILSSTTDLQRITGDYFSKSLAVPVTPTRDAAATTACVGDVPNPHAWIFGDDAVAVGSERKGLRTNVRHEVRVNWIVAGVPDDGVSAGSTFGGEGSGLGGLVGLGISLPGAGMGMGMGGGMGGGGIMSGSSGMGGGSHHVNLEPSKVNVLDSKGGIIATLTPSSSTPLSHKKTLSNLDGTVQTTVSTQMTPLAGSSSMATASFARPERGVREIEAFRFPILVHALGQAEHRGILEEYVKAVRALGNEMEVVKAEVGLQKIAYRCKGGSSGQVASSTSAAAAGGGGVNNGGNGGPSFAEKGR